MINEIKDLLMTPVDMFIRLEETVTCKGLAFLLLTVTVCYMQAMQIPISVGFGELFKIILYLYFGGGTAKLVHGMLTEEKKK